MKPLVGLGLADGETGGGDGAGVAVVQVLASCCLATTGGVMAMVVS